MKSLPLLAVALVLGSSSWGRAARADEVAEIRSTLDKASGVSETDFPNGLKLLVKPQPENPVVTCMIWYAVGSRDEGVGETGLSHYLEHMLFKGSDKYPKGAIDKVTQMNGGSNNASTRNDATEYHFTFPADTWEVALEIEANRMRNSNCQQAEFDAEKKVVLNELWMGLDDPSDVLYTQAMSALFVAGRYHAPVIGWQEDVESTTRERMMAYYLKHYTPDRATIVVVGGCDRMRTIEKVGAMFGAIPRGTVKRYELKEPKTLGETRLTLLQNTQVPRLLMAFRSMPTLDPAEPLLDVFSSILSGDKTSRFEKALVDTGIAVSAEAFSDTRRDDGCFVVQAQPADGKTLEDVEAAIRGVLKDVLEKGVTADEIKLARTKILADRVFGRESSMTLASRLGSAAVLGDWRYQVRYADVLEGATPETVLAAAKRAIDLDRLVVARSVPNAPAAEATGGGGKAPEGATPAEGAAGAPKRSSLADAGDKGARSARYREDPASGAGAVAAAPSTPSEIIAKALTLEPTRTVLKNGLTLLVLERKTAPVFAASLQVLDGRLGEEVAGLDEMTGSLLEEGTTERSGADLAAAIGAVGGTLSFSGDGVSTKTLSKDAALALDLMAEAIRKPAFAADAIERVRGQQLSSIAEELDTPRAIGQDLFNRAIYGAAHPLGRSVHGVPETVKAITREQILAHHAKFFVPKNATLAIVSDRKAADVAALVEKAFGDWTGGDRPAVATPAIPEPAARVIRRPVEAEQANIFVGHLGIERKDPDYTALEVFDNVFGVGAGFTSRLAMNVRDQKGLAYTVFGSITGNAGIRPGTLRLFAGTKPKDWPVALKEMHAELEGLLTRPPTPDELAGAKAALRGDMVTSCEGSSEVAKLLLRLERFGLGFDYPKRHLDEISKITAEDVVRVAKAHVRPDRLVELIVAPGVEAQGLDAAPAR
jgi:zinc protease